MDAGRRLVDRIARGPGLPRTVPGGGIQPARGAVERGRGVLDRLHDVADVGLDGRRDREPRAAAGGGRLGFLGQAVRGGLGLGGAGRRSIDASKGIEVLEAARALIDKVIVTPGDRLDDPPGIELVGQLMAMLKAAGAFLAGDDTSSRNPVGARTSWSA